MAESRSARAGSEPPATSPTYGPVAPKVSDEALIERLTTERDRYAVLLLSAEQELAKRSVAEPDALKSYREAYFVLVDSTSWRLTRPLRVATRLARETVRRRIKR